MSTLPSSSVLFARLLAKGRLRHLQLLAAVADQGSVKRAAELVGMSQPAATQALTELEQLLAAPLFERHARGMRLLPAGRAVVPVVRNVLQALQASTESLSALQQGESLLRVGVIPAAASGLLGRFVTEFCTRHPEVRLEVHEDRGEHLSQELLSGALDLVLCRRPTVVPAPLNFVPVLADEAVVLAGPAHPLRKQQGLTLHDLRDAQWMLAPAGIQVREVFDRLFAEQTPAPRAHAVSTTSQTLLVDILQTPGTVALVPRSLARSLCDWGLVVTLDVALDAHFDGLGALCAASTADHPTAQVFIEALIRSHAPA